MSSFSDRRCRLICVGAPNVKGTCMLWWHGLVPLACLIAAGMRRAAGGAKVERPTGRTTLTLPRPTRHWAGTASSCWVTGQVTTATSQRVSRV